MMIFKLTIGQKLSLKTLISLSILLLSMASGGYWLGSHNEKLNTAQQVNAQDLQQELDKYQTLYQQQLAINQQLQAQSHLPDNTDEESEESAPLLGKAKFEQVLQSAHALQGEQYAFEDSQSILLPLNPAVETSLFRMIPNDTPVDYKRVSSPFGERTHPISGKWSRHLGMDLTCPRGSPIFATADGVVEITRPSNQGYGNMIKIRHAFGFMTLYAHLNQFAVKTGQFVEKGDRIGFCGSSGNSTGSHLHYEVRFIGRTLNPKDFMQWQPSEIAQLFSQQKQVPWASLIAQLKSTVNLQVLLAISSKEHALKPANKQVRANPKGLTEFGIEEDGWATVEE